MVLAAKRAVGSEYGYPGNYALPKYKKQNRRKKRTLRITSLHKIICGVTLIAAFFLTGLSYTCIKALSAQLNLQVNQLKRENLTIQMDNEKMKLEIARLKSLDRIENIASSRLGMVKDPTVEYLDIEYVNTTTGQGATVGIVASKQEESALDTKTQAPGSTFIGRIAAAIQLERKKI